jgi:hypothetical protein
MQNTDSSQNPNIHKCALLESHTTTIHACALLELHTTTIHAQRQVVLESQLQLTQILLESQPPIIRTQIAYSNHNHNTDSSHNPILRTQIAYSNHNHNTETRGGKIQQSFFRPGIFSNHPQIPNILICLPLSIQLPTKCYFLRPKIKRKAVSEC